MSSSNKSGFTLLKSTHSFCLTFNSPSALSLPPSTLTPPYQCHSPAHLASPLGLLSARQLSSWDRNRYIHTNMQTN